MKIKLILALCALALVSCTSPEVETEQKVNPQDTTEVYWDANRTM